MKRHRTLRGGYILLSGKSGTLDVLVRDMNEHGARLRLKSVCTLPQRFALAIIDPNQNTFTTRKCQLVWHFGNDVGVAFNSIDIPDRFERDAREVWPDEDIAA